jgi:hypothetical protein
MTTGRNEFIKAGGHSVCLHEHEIKSLLGVSRDIHTRLFVDSADGECVQTMLVKGEARMEALALQIIALQGKLEAHEARPKKVLGFVAVVLPLVITVGSAMYWVSCWIIDHFHWKTP